MPSFIVKPKADEDFYVVWSTVVDAPTAWGDRSELERDLGSVESSPERFDRADATGTSMNDPEIRNGRQWFGWHDKEFMLMEWDIPNRQKGVYQVPRENVRALCEAYDTDIDITPLLTFEPWEGLTR